MDLPLGGRICLVTGDSRGIDATGTTITVLSVVPVGVRSRRISPAAARILPARSPSRAAPAVPSALDRSPHLGKSTLLPVFKTGGKIEPFLA